MKENAVVKYHYSHLVKNVSCAQSQLTFDCHLQCTKRFKNRKIIQTYGSRRILPKSVIGNHIGLV